MMRLSTLLSAALGTAVLTAALAQGTGVKSKPASSPAKSTPASTPAKPASADDAAVVGSVGGMNVTWGQLVADMTKENPQILSGSVAQMVAAQAAQTFYGPHPSDTFTITRAQATALLRTHPTKQIADQLELMMTRIAVDKEATRENVQATDKQVADKVDSLLKQLRTSDPPAIPKGQTDDQFLAEHGTSRAKLLVNFRPQVQVLNLIHKDIEKKLKHPIGPDDMLQARHILLMTNGIAPELKDDERKKAEAAILTKLQGIAADIKAGKISFEDAAKASSEDPSTKGQGGDLGTFLRGEMLPEFDAAAFKATPGVVTDPVKTSYGYHIILVTKLGKDIPAADRAKHLDQYEEKQIPNFLQQVTTNEKVENRLQALLPPQTGMQMRPGGGRPQ